MPMVSMTGCGRGKAENGLWEITVELKSVNHRFLDISCRLPRTWSFLEDTVRKGLQTGLKRGHVEVYVTVEAQGEDAASREVRVDTALAARYVTAAVPADGGQTYRPGMILRGTFRPEEIGLSRGSCLLFVPEA